MIGNLLPTTAAESDKVSLVTKPAAPGVPTVETPGNTNESMCKKKTPLAVNLRWDVWDRVPLQRDPT